MFLLRADVTKLNLASVLLRTVLSVHFFYVLNRACGIIYTASGCLWGKICGKTDCFAHPSASWKAYLNSFAAGIRTIQYLELFYIFGSIEHSISYVCFFYVKVWNSLSLLSSLLAQMKWETKFSFTYLPMKFTALYRVTNFFLNHNWITMK